MGRRLRRGLRIGRCRRRGGGSYVGDEMVGLRMHGLDEEEEGVGRVSTYM